MISKISRIFMLAGAVAFLLSDNSASAQFPNWKAKPVRPRIDVIPPLGNNLPLSYRARMNRPTYLGGRIAYTIEPSSQEAMAWQKAWERGYYADHAPRMETHYMFPKPWEVLGVGAKPKRADDKSPFSQPDRSPLSPINDEDPADDAATQQESERLKKLEKLETPPAEPLKSDKPLNTAPALVPRGQVDSRPATDPPAALELAPAIQLDLKVND